MAGNGGWLSISGVEKVLFDTPAPRRGERSTRAQIFNRDPKANERVADLVARLKSKIKEPSKH